jgi:DNA-binding transcriptional regulator YiaG
LGPTVTREEARTILVAVGQPPARVLRALRTEVNLSDFVLSPVLGRSAQTIRRWRRDAKAEVPDSVNAAIDDLRTIVAMMIGAGFDGSTIKQFLLSRNTGLGQDRPLDGIQVGLEAFRRVEHITECFIAGIAPEPGPALSTGRGEEFEPMIATLPKDPDSPHQPIGAPK